MANDFLNPIAGPRTSIYDLSHEHKTTVDMGYLTPSLLLEAIPGDSFRIRPEVMLRFIPMIAPVMHRIHVIQDFYFVPNRILWENWQKWMVGEEEVELPYMTIPISAPNNINTFGSEVLDFLGIPSGLSPAVFNSYKLNAMPLAAYNRIYSEYYRDQNLQTEPTWSEPLSNGSNTLLLAERFPFRRAWEHDYFTSALPWAQKGDPVRIPLFNGDRADVEYDNTDQALIINRNTGLPITVGATTLKNQNGTGAFYSETVTPAGFDPNGSLYVPDDSAATINDLRAALMLQEYLERNARGGTRYIEWIQAHFGVSSSDGRLQRPEFIGRVKQQVVISEVLSTAETDDDVVGGLAGHGISYASGEPIQWRAEEHGYIMGILNVQPTTSYSQGIHRLWSRRQPLDFPIPVFANLGEQEVRNKEIYADATDGFQEGTFGYQPNYHEMRYAYNRTSSGMNASFEYWHLGSKYTSRPHLNSTFIQADVSKRIFAVETPFTMDSVIVSMYFDIKKISKLPKFGIPGIPNMNVR